MMKHTKTIRGIVVLSVLVLALSVLTVTALSAMGDANKDDVADAQNAVSALVRTTASSVVPTMTTSTSRAVTTTAATTTSTATISTTTAATTTTATTTTTAVTTTVATTHATEPTLPIYAQVDPFPLTDFEQRMFDLINEERAKAGVAPLRFAYEDYECTKIRAREQMQAEGHTRPDGRGCRTVYEDLGMTIPEYCGENLALYQPTSELAMEGLMNSPGHRANILNENYTAVVIGVEFDEEGYPIYAQLFKR